jgi:hypothetical protein
LDISRIFLTRNIAGSVCNIANNAKKGEGAMSSPSLFFQPYFPYSITNSHRHGMLLQYEKHTQTWKTFLLNHKEIWAMDFATVTTLAFKTLYVLVIIAHDRRKMVYFAVTENPTAQWMIQQIRNATPFGIQPKYLLHDNGSVFVEKYFQNFLKSINVKSKRITPYSPWQNGICERFIGIMRRDLLDHIIPFNERHLERLLKEYVDYYNNVRTHQALNGETPIKSTPPKRTTSKNTFLHSKPILGGLYHSYEKHSNHKGTAA